MTGRDLLHHHRVIMIMCFKKMRPRGIRSNVTFQSPAVRVTAALGRIVLSFFSSHCVDQGPIRTQGSPLAIAKASEGQDCIHVGWPPTGMIQMQGRLRHPSTRAN